MQYALSHRTFACCTDVTAVHATTAFRPSATCPRRSEYSLSVVCLVYVCGGVDWCCCCRWELALTYAVYGSTLNTTIVQSSSKQLALNPEMVGEIRRRAVQVKLCVVSEMRGTCTAHLHVMLPDLHVVSPDLHVVSPDLHMVSPDLHVVSPDLHVVSPACVISDTGNC